MAVLHKKCYITKVESFTYQSRRGPPRGGGVPRALFPGHIVLTSSRPVMLVGIAHIHRGPVCLFGSVQSKFCPGAISLCAHAVTLPEGYAQLPANPLFVFVYFIVKETSCGVQCIETAACYITRRVPLLATFWPICVCVCV